MPDAGGNFKGISVPALPWLTCATCRVEPAEGEHTCPYAEDVCNDSETLCNCCADCEQQCAMDI